MSFQKINKEDSTEVQGRECLLVYGIEGKDYIKLKNYCSMMGIRDIIQIDKGMLGKKIKNILEDRLEGSVCEEDILEKAIVINAFPGQKLHVFLSNFSKTGLSRPLMATVTPTSINWTVKDLILELQKEREAIKKNEQALHEKNNK